jgi:hypothetical protein
MARKEGFELQLRVPLQGDLLEKFNALKQKYGVENNTEVVRILLNRIYNEEFPPKSVPAEVPA